MPIAPIEGWEMDLDGRMIPGTPSPAPADGDNYACEPRPAHRPPLIPRQWVGLEDYRQLERRVEALERALGVQP
jgi:hypothetical protein